MPWNHSYLQSNFNKRFDERLYSNKESDGFEPNVEGSSPSKTFFIIIFFFFFFLLSQRSREFFAIYMFAEKSCFDVLCTCKATSVSKIARFV